MSSLFGKGLNNQCLSTYFYIILKWTLAPLHPTGVHPVYLWPQWPCLHSGADLLRSFPGFLQRWPEKSKNYQLEKATVYHCSFVFNSFLKVTNMSTFAATSRTFFPNAAGTTLKALYLNGKRIQFFHYRTLNIRAFDLIWWMFSWFLLWSQDDVLKWLGWWNLFTIMNQYCLSYSFF